jgi:hypothetical protein
MDIQSVPAAVLVLRELILGVVPRRKYYTNIASILTGHRAVDI